jgi:hypothetical protein
LAKNTTNQFSAKEKKVIEYIKTYQKKGYSTSEIRKALKKSDVKEKTINKCMNIAGISTPFYKSKILWLIIGAIILLTIGTIAIINLWPECTTDKNCPIGYTCSDNVCILEPEIVAEECRSDFDCSTGFVCHSGICRSIIPEPIIELSTCDYDLDCGSGYKCVSNECIKKGAVSQCGDGRCDIGEEDCELDCDSGDGSSGGSSGGGSGGSGTTDTTTTTQDVEVCNSLEDDDADGTIDVVGGCDIDEDGDLDYTCGCFNEDKETITFGTDAGPYSCTGGKKAGCYNLETKTFRRHMICESATYLEVGEVLTLDDGGELSITEITTSSVYLTIEDESDKIKIGTLERIDYGHRDTANSLYIKVLDAKENAFAVILINDTGREDGTYYAGDTDCSTCTDDSCNGFGCQWQTDTCYDTCNEEIDCAENYHCETNVCVVDGKILSVSCGSDFKIEVDNSVDIYDKNLTLVDISSTSAVVEVDSISEIISIGSKENVNGLEIIVIDTNFSQSLAILQVGCVTETTGPRCSDEWDNDGDGYTDYPLDRGCTTPWDDVELNKCGDNVDNDGDGFIDMLDPECLSPAGQSEKFNLPRCNDGWDNDGDGLSDQDDPDCDDIYDDYERKTSKLKIKLKDTIMTDLLPIKSFAPEEKESLLDKIRALIKNTLLK